MKKKEYYQNDNDEVTKEAAEEVAVVEAVKPKAAAKPVEPECGFDKAIRIYKRQNPGCVSWNEASVELFAVKKLKKKTATLPEWFAVFKNY